jgi:transcriptional regulator with XRE-family HTH domain
MKTEKLQEKDKGSVTVLKQIREQLGLTQFELASEIGCALSVITKAEAGQSEPRFNIEQWGHFQLLLKKAGYTGSKLPRKLSEKIPA